MRRNKNREIDGDIDMTPMLDVVFILLIFFIVSSSLDQSNKLEVTLPSASKSEKTIEKNLEFQVRADSTVVFHDEIYDLIDAYNIILENSSHFKSLLIMADKDLRTEVFVKLADFAKANGFETVSIATKENK